MIRLGLREGRGTKTLSDLSMDQGISLSYLEQLFAQLRRSGLVIGVRGPGGGYRLARKARDISLSSIITAVDEQAYPDRSGNGDVSNTTNLMWQDVSDRLYRYLGTVTLADVLQGYSKEAGNDAEFDQFLNHKVA